MTARIAPPPRQEGLKPAGPALDAIAKRLALQLHLPHPKKPQSPAKAAR